MEPGGTVEATGSGGGARPDGWSYANAIAVRAFERARSPTVALYRDTPKGPSHEGSGVLLSIGETDFLLTASHVCAAIEGRRSSHLLGGFGRQSPLVELPECAAIRSSSESPSNAEEW